MKGTDCDMISTEDEKEESSRKAILVILVGAPGSGKSTFCDDVMKTSARSWVRVCQDTIGNGKAGTKSQCIKSATEALKNGKNVFIDRCNLEREQRSDFLKLGSPDVDVHAVVLDLPAKLCISRSVKRSGHEGNLQGGRAAAVVNKMLQKKELPKLSEGFSRITFCQKENDVEEAVKTYSDLGPLDTLPSGCFGQKNPDAKVQLGIMRFMKKLEVPQSSSQNTSTVSKEESEENDPSCEKRDQVDSSAQDMDEEVTEVRDLSVDSSTAFASLNHVSTLAFPSISTSDFQFNIEKASDIIVEKVEEFLNKLGNARLVLVDLTSGSKILTSVKAKAAQRSIDSNKFFTFVGDITQLYSKGGLRCDAIANAANWRLKPGGGGVNAAIFSAAGPTLEIETKKLAGSLSPGSALLVPLSPNSPLYKRELVTHVIHVLGPNMNPQRPNNLSNDYDKGCKVLREAYSSLFEAFASTMKVGSSNVSSNQLERTSMDPSRVSDQKSKREGVYVADKNKKCKGLQDEVRGQQISKSNEKGKLSGSNDASEVRNQQEKDGDDGGTPKAWGSWAQSLYHIAMHPEKHKKDVIEISDDVVVLNDLYPKARKHLLVLARKDGLDRLADVREEHLPLLRTMHVVGMKWAKKLLSEEKNLIFRLGYHLVPSMRQLHLHVISQDFDSTSLKNKKHWNSFNTPFFLDSVDVIEEIEKYGKAKLNNDENLMSTELRCNRCKSAHPNIPRLKSHINNCRAPFPPSLLGNNRLVLASSETTTEVQP